MSGLVQASMAHNYSVIVWPECATQLQSNINEDLLAITQ